MTIIIMTLMVIFSIGLFLSSLHTYRLQKRLQSHKKMISKLQSEIRSISNSSFGLGNRTVAIEKKINLLKSKHQDFVSYGSENDFQKRTYKQATHLAQMGASVDELIESCEISHGEAELLTHMNLN